MQEVGVPTVPGSVGIVPTEQEAEQVALEIGYPVIVKASAGGGGRVCEFCDPCKHAGLHSTPG